MIESMTASGVISPLPVAGERRPKPLRVQFFRDLAERSANCLTTVESHITGAPIGIDIRARGGKLSPLIATFDLPVARALVGQGLVHGGAECIGPEKTMAKLLFRKILVEQKLMAEEVSRFVGRVRVTSTNLVWSIDMSSRDAALEMLEHAARQVKVLRDHNDNDWYGIQDHVFVNTTTEVSLQIVLGCGSGLKLSMQPEFLSKYLDLHTVPNVSTKDILAMTKTHIRVEVTIGKLLLDDLRNGRLSGWTSAGLDSCIDAVWAEAGFMLPYMPNPAMLSTKGYPREARAIHKWYLQYQGLDENYDNVLDDLLLRSGYDLQLRHDGTMFVEGSDGEQLRNFLALMRSDGVDTRVRPGEHKFLDGSIGAKLHYSNRWQVPKELMDLVVSKRTEPRLILALAKFQHPPRLEILNDSERPITWL